jgi:hypothetical protein
LGKIETEASKESKNQDVIIMVLGLVFVLALASSGIFFLAFWEKYSTGETFDVQPEYKRVDGTTIVTEKATIVIDNYYPFISRWFIPYIEKEIDDHQGNVTTLEIGNRPESYAAENITIQQMAWKTTYLDGSDGPQLTEINPNSISEVDTAGMSRNIITLTWSYNKTENPYSPEVFYLLQYHTVKNNPLGVTRFFDYIYFMRSDQQKLVFGVLFYCSSAFAGFFLTWLILLRRTDYKKARRYLKQFDYNQMENANSTTELSYNLKVLKYFPNLLRSAWRFLLGLSLLLFKVHVANCCKYYRDECNLECKMKFQNEFSNNAVLVESKVSDLLPEKQTILILIGLLTSFGVTFSFNLGALAPFTYSLVVFYIFLNIGSTFYLFGRTRDLIWPSILFAIAILAVSAPAIFSMLRVAMI